MKKDNPYGRIGKIYIDRPKALIYLLYVQSVSKTGLFLKRR